MFGLKKISVLTSVATAALLTLSSANANELKVVATFSIIGDLAQNIGGERIALTTLVDPDNDAHMYEPRPADVTAVKDADVVLANGAHFEGFLERLVQASGSTANVVELTKGINLLRSTGDDHHHHEGHGHDDDHAESHGHDHGEYDPHAWQSVHNARIYVNNIVQAFCNADQGGCPSYRANAESYGKKLEALQKELEAMVQQIPSDKRTVITSHDAFAYLGHEYGLQFLAPQGTSTGSEASAGDVAKLIQQIKQQKASAIFLENISNPKLIQQLASETGMKIGGKLYSDALSAQGGDADTYIHMMRHNIRTIRDATLAR